MSRRVGRSREVLGAEMPGAERSRVNCEAAHGRPDESPAIQAATEPACDAAASAAVSALELHDLSFSYSEHGKRPLIQGLSLSIPAGQVMGIVGPNGCGKSTLLKLIDGLLVPLAGEVLIEGDPLARLSTRERARRVALLPQVHRTPSMTVEALVMCGRYAHMGAFGRATELDRKIVAEAMRATGIEHMATRPARALSGGERQSAFIAMALAQQANILLLDEPTTYLDVRAAHETMALVRKLSAERGLTVVMVLHDLDLALRTCDSIAVMSDGRIAAEGSPAEVLATGELERVFGVRIMQLETPAGAAYTCY